MGTMRRGDELRVERIINHPQWDNNTLSYDFSLLRLATATTLKKKVKKVVLLPSTNNRIATGSPVMVTGWGDMKYGSNKTPDYLRGVNLTTISQENCSSAWGRPITSEKICATDPDGTGKEKCQVSFRE